MVVHPFVEKYISHSALQTLLLLLELLGIYLIKDDDPRDECRSKIYDKAAFFYGYNDYAIHDYIAVML